MVTEQLWQADFTELFLRQNRIAQLATIAGPRQHKRVDGLSSLSAAPPASVNAGSGKDSKLKGKDFFDAEHDPLITFHLTKIVQTGPNTLDYVGDFTIRGVTKTEKLTFTLTGKGTGAGEVKGTMAFERNDYSMNSSIPFIKIADRVEVTIDLKDKQVSGPPLVFKQ
jgi:hypothetical protein